MASHVASLAVWVAGRWRRATVTRLRRVRTKHGLYGTEVAINPRRWDPRTDINKRSG
jgi:hypothetical protein